MDMCGTWEYEQSASASPSSFPLDSPTILNMLEWQTSSISNHGRLFNATQCQPNKKRKMCKQNKQLLFVRLNLDASGAESSSNGWILLFSLAAWCWVIPAYWEPGKLGYEWMMGGPVQSKYEPNRKPLHSSVPIYWSPILLDLATDTCWNAFNLKWQWTRTSLNLSTFKRPQSPRHQTLLALRLRRLKHFCGDERETLIHGVRNIFL